MNYFFICLRFTKIVVYLQRVMPAGYEVQATVASNTTLVVE
jgi:hypothetical protein